MKFCGFELRRGQNNDILVGQEAYAVELCRRHGCSRSRPTPMSTSLADRMPRDKDEDIDLELLRKARAITGEILWLMVRSRPDLAFVAGVMGRLSSRNPGYVLELGKEVLEYVFGTPSLSLSYGACDKESYGADNHLPFSRSMTRVECCSDVSFAPQGGRSIQGVVAMVGGRPVQWESSRQTCITLGTAEAELLTYVEAAVIADNMACLVEVLEQVSSQAPLPDDDEHDGDESPGAGITT